MGKIAGALAAAQEEQTPLQRRLDELGRTLSKLVLGICVFIFVFDLIAAGSFTLESVLSTFMVAVSLAVAAIPEGLATVVTVVLSIGVTNMSKRNAVIRRLTAVETLGCTQVICSDKTGTLTPEQDDRRRPYRRHQDAGHGHGAVQRRQPGRGRPGRGRTHRGRARQLCGGRGPAKNELQAAQPRVDEAPFDSGRKMMSTVHALDGAFIQYTKGAPDVVLDRCTTCLENGEIVPLTDEKRAEILAANKAMADRALRVLAAAERRWPARPEKNEPEFLENDLCFVGLTGMIDPVRPRSRPPLPSAARPASAPS